MNRLFLILFSLALVSRTFAIDRTAASASRADVGTAYAACVSGADRLIIPAGTAEWTQVLYATKDVDIIGAGITQTVIRDSIDYRIGGTGNSNWDRAVFILAPPTGSTVRISGIKIEHGNDLVIGGVTQGAYAVGAIQTEANATFLIDNIFTTMLRRRALYFWGGSKGVVSQCRFDLRFGVQAMVFYTNALYSGVSGDGSWVNPPAYGQGIGQEWFYVEDCEVNGDIGGGLNMTDGFAGAKFVVRFCDIGEIGVGAHGSESANRYRGARAFEVYNNIFSDAGGAADYSTIELRSGAGKFFNNTSTGTWTHDFVLTNYRNWAAFPPWGGADGTHLWDVADTTDGAGTPGGAGDGVFDSGSADTLNSLDWTATTGITVSQAIGSANVVASAPIFTSAMVGKHIFIATPGSFLYNRRITSFTSSTSVVTSTDLNPTYLALDSTTSANRAFTDLRFIVGDNNVMRDSTKAWSPTDKWAGYTLREKTGNFTVASVSSASTREITVSGAPDWAPGQWFYWDVTNNRTNDKYTIQSNTTNMFKVSTNGPNHAFLVGDTLYFSRASEIDNSTSTTITTKGQGATQSDYLTFSGLSYEIRKIDHALDQPGRGQTSALSATGIQIQHQVVNQQLDPVYSWGNYKNGSRWTPLIAEASIRADREFFMQPATFDGTTGTGVGTAAQMAAITPTTTGVGFWVTDEGEWWAAHSGPDGRFYTWSGSAWVLNYTPYTYPHPLVSGAPSVSSASVSGTTLSLTFNKSVTGVSAADFTLSGSTLSAATGSGTTWSMTVSPTTEYGTTYTLNYTAGGVTDGSTPMASFSGLVPTNNNGIPSVRNPGRSNVKKGLF